MINLYYALRVAKRATWSNFWKIFSLAMGILIGSVIICRTAFFASYDDYMQDQDKTYFLTMNASIGTESYDGLAGVFPAMAPTLMAEIPDIEKATRFGRTNQNLKSDRGEFSAVSLATDSLFFDLFPIEILEGEVKSQYRDNGGIVISKSMAEKLFNGGNALNEVVTINNRKLTVRAIFADFAPNSYHKNVDLIFNANISNTQWFNDGWYTFFKLSHKCDIDELSKNINKAFAPHIEKGKVVESMQVAVFAHPFKKFSEYADFGDSGAGAMNYLFVIIGFCVVLIVSLNFALMQINSLVSRHKEVGVHKASGATSSQVFSLVIAETVFYTIFGLLLSVAMLFAFNAQLETMVGLPIKDIFALKYLWSVGVVLLVVVIVAGVVPAVIFARIPVSSIFRNLKSVNLWWKHILLFLEVTSAMAVISVALGVLLQYNYAMNFNLGYDYSKLYSVNLNKKISKREAETLKEEILKLPEIEGATIAHRLPISGWTGFAVTKKGESTSPIWFRSNYVDRDFFKVYGIKVLEGDFSQFSPTSGFINQTGLDVLGTITEMNEYDFSGAESIGIISELRQNVYNSITPMIFLENSEDWHTMTLTVKGITNVSAKVNNKIQKVLDDLHPTLDFEVAPYKQEVEIANSDIRIIRNGVFTGALVLIISTLIGVISYILTEIKARRRQIVIRRTFGASVMDIVHLVGVRLFFIAAVSMVASTVISYKALNLLLAMVGNSINISLYIVLSGAVVIGLVIFVVIYIETSKIAKKEYGKLIGKI